MQDVLEAFSSTLRREEVMAFVQPLLSSAQGFHQWQEPISTYIGFRCTTGCLLKLTHSRERINPVASAALDKFLSDVSLTQEVRACLQSVQAFQGPAGFLSVLHEQGALQERLAQRLDSILEEGIRAEQGK